MSRPHVVSPSELQSLRDLELVTRRTVEGLRQGLHRSPFHGYNAEFSQYRRYRPGDDLKYVDWKAFARTDRLYTRQFRETTNLSALFVIDVSRSMNFAGKFDLARQVTAILGTLVLDQGDAAGVLAVDGHARRLVPPRSGHHHLRLFLAQLAQLTATGGAGLTDALTQAATVMTRRGLVIVVSDFYEEDEALPLVRRLARMGHDVVVVHTLAREELSLDIGGAAELVDLESGRTLVVQPSAVREGYAAAVQQWLAKVHDAVTGDGLEYLRLVTGAPLEPALRRFLMSRRGGG
jgi:uncharacterized protein (DUF58 family)